MTEHTDEGGPLLREGRCISCEHWRQPWQQASEGSAYERPNRDAEAEWGVCVKIRHPGLGTYSVEEAEQYGWPRPSPTPSPRAFTADGSDYLSELSTRADFGCVEWSARPSPYSPGDSNER